MPNVTTCSRCSRLYEASSEEIAAEPDRLCPWCIGPEAVARYKRPPFRGVTDRVEVFDEDPPAPHRRKKP